jgi:large subunit ribosomal protein L4
MAKETRVVKKAVKPEAKTPRKLGRLYRLVFDMSGKEVGLTELPKDLFDAPVNKPLLTQALRVYIAESHQGTSASKSRGEVRGGGRKPWKQKGTGRARAGSIRDPQWRGGGVVFGPQPKDKSLTLPSRMKRAALRSALSAKAPDVVIVKDFKLKEPKTRLVAQTLKKLDLVGQTLFVLPDHNTDLLRAGKNLQDLKITSAADLNALQVLSARKLVLAQGSIEKLRERQ